jgi:hypothetical protein
MQINSQNRGTGSNDHSRDVGKTIRGGIGEGEAAFFVFKLGAGNRFGRDGRTREVWWARKDLNLGPMDYESTALTAELRAPTWLQQKDST